MATPTKIQSSFQSHGIKVHGQIKLRCKLIHKNTAAKTVLFSRLCALRVSNSVLLYTIFHNYIMESAEFYEIRTYFDLYRNFGKGFCLLS